MFIAFSICDKELFCGHVTIPPTISLRTESWFKIYAQFSGFSFLTPLQAPCLQWENHLYLENHWRYWRISWNFWIWLLVSVKKSKFSKSVAFDFFWKFDKELFVSKSLNFLSLNAELNEFKYLHNIQIFISINKLWLILYTIS